jgi:polygalacturonase
MALAGALVVLVGALFLKSEVELRIDAGVTLYGSHDDADYPDRPTRVAGIEMTWPAGRLNVDGQHNVRISGGGTIDGRGEKWWDLFEDDAPGAFLQAGSEVYRLARAERVR